MKLFILFIALNAYTTAIYTAEAAAPKPLVTQTHPLHFLTNMACKVSILCRMRTPTPKEDDEKIVVLASEPGKKTTLEFENGESFYFRGVSVQPDRNLPAEYTESSEDISLPEYGIIFELPPTIGNEPLVLTINETYTVKGYLKGQGVVFTHTIDYALQETGIPTDTPICAGELPYQPPS